MCVPFCQSRFPSSVLNKYKSDHFLPFSLFFFFSNSARSKIDPTGPRGRIAPFPYLVYFVIIFAQKINKRPKVTRLTALEILNPLRKAKFKMILEFIAPI